MIIKPCVLCKLCLNYAELGDEACAGCDQALKWDPGKSNKPCIEENKNYICIALQKQINDCKTDFEKALIICSFISGLEFAGYNKEYLWNDFCEYLFFDALNSNFSKSYLNELKKISSRREE